STAHETGGRRPTLCPSNLRRPQSLPARRRLHLDLPPLCYCSPHEPTSPPYGHAPAARRGLRQRPRTTTSPRQRLTTKRPRPVVVPAALYDRYRRVSWCPTRTYLQLPRHCLTSGQLLRWGTETRKHLGFS